MLEKRDTCLVSYSTLVKQQTNKQNKITEMTYKLDLYTIIDIEFLKKGETSNTYTKKMPWHLIFTTY